ncbi:MAG: hypothetical protein IPK16_34095 [Anaerolineales bacterium]|nr:hypothetical protein [Anaerolineales bacterium]
MREERFRLEWLHQQLTFRLAQKCAAENRRHDLGIAACTRLLALEPEREEVHRLLMRLLAQDGQRTAALKQYDLCTGALLDELGVPPSAETNALYDQILAGELAGAPLASLQVERKLPPFQAPAPPAHFVGRDAALARLASWLTQTDASSVVAIVVMGGIGKTGLAAQLAERLRPQFADGVLWARVSTGDPLDILQSWAQAYDKDVSKIGNAEARAAAVRAILAEKQTLIVLDDVAPGSPVDLLLPGVTTCPVLITTRDRAEVAARTTFALELGELTVDEGIELLRVYLGAGAVDAEDGAAHLLYTVLGGLPLAMEIAAQRVFASPRRSLGRMVRSLEGAGERLAHGISNRSVRTSFDASWSMLTPELQQVFACTGLFGGRSFSQFALAATAELPAGSALDALDQLVMLSMLKLDAGDRYVQHRLLADFAGEQLAARPDARAVRIRYATYYSSLARSAAGDYSQLDEEWDNLLAAVEQAQVAQAWSLTVAVVDALAAPWFARGRLHQARRGFQFGVEAATALHDEPARARFAFFLGKTLLRQDEYAEARQMLGLAQAWFETIQDERRLADVYVDMADVNLEEEKLAEAATALAAAHSIYLALHQPVGVAVVLNRQAMLAYYAGDDATAVELCQTGLAQLPPGDGPLIRSRTLRLLAEIAISQRQLARAAVYFEQAQDANRLLNDQTEHAAILYAKAKLDHHLGYDRDALGVAELSAQIYAAMGDRKAVAMVQILISMLHSALRDTAAARRSRVKPFNCASTR